MWKQEHAPREHASRPHRKLKITIPLPLSSCQSCWHLHGAEFVVHIAIRRCCQLLSIWIEMVPDGNPKTIGSGNQFGEKS